MSNLNWCHGLTRNCVTSLWILIARHPWNLVCISDTSGCSFLSLSSRSNRIYGTCVDSIFQIFDPLMKTPKGRMNIPLGFLRPCPSPSPRICTHSASLSSQDLGFSTLILFSIKDRPNLGQMWWHPREPAEPSACSSTKCKQWRKLSRIGRIQTQSWTIWWPYRFPTPQC